MLIVTIADPENLGTGRVELAVDGLPLGGDYVAFPTGGGTQHAIARLRPTKVVLASAP